MLTLTTSHTPRRFILLAVGAGGQVAAASSYDDADLAALPGVRGDPEVWHPGVPAGRLLDPGDPVGPVSGFAFTPDGGRLVVADHYYGVSVTDLRTGEVRRTGVTRPGLPARYWGRRVAFSAGLDRLLIAANGDTRGHLSAWRFDPDFAGELLWKDDPLDRVFAPAVAPDGRRMAAVTRDPYADRPRQTVELRDGETGRVLRTTPHDPADPVGAVGFTADGARLLVRTRSRVVTVFDAGTGEPAGELVHKGRAFVTGMAVSPAGPIATSRTDGTVTLWDPVTLRKLTGFDWKVGRLASVAFSPDGSLAAAGTEDGKVVVWDV